MNVLVKEILRDDKCMKLLTKTLEKLIYEHTMMSTHICRFIIVMTSVGFELRTSCTQSGCLAICLNRQNLEKLIDNPMLVFAVA